eukprot:2731891-Amphidinium_carterae.1
MSLTQKDLQQWSCTAIPGSRQNTRRAHLDASHASTTQPCLLQIARRPFESNMSQLVSAQQSVGSKLYAGHAY